MTPEDTSLTRFDPNAYGPVFAELLHGDRLRPLGPGNPELRLRPRLETLTVERAFAPHAVRDGPMASAYLAAVWLLYDFLDESHSISQSIPTATGSYWHSLMHRREPDLDNDTSWGRRPSRPFLVIGTGRGQ